MDGPGTAWTNAFRAIQDAVDVATNAGDLVLVTNGVYNAGGIDGNRVQISGTVTVSSVNGPEVTVIDGARAVRCVRLAVPGAALSGFTLTSGVVTGELTGGGVYLRGGTIVSNCFITGCLSESDGGGVYYWLGGTLDHCALSGNSASAAGSCGGGAYFYGGGSARHCLFFGNLATNSSSFGGGAYLRNGGTLEHCTVYGNSAGNSGGGVASLSGESVENCIIYGNTAYNVGNWHNISCSYCCTTPDPGGTGNITNNPLFADAAVDDFHLKSTAGRWDPASTSWVFDAELSPCIDAADPLSDFGDEPVPNGGRANIGYYGNTLEASRTPPNMTITNPASNITVYEDVDSYTVSGTMLYLTGTLVWTNALNGSNGTMAAVSPWEVADIGLAFGSNTITVSGTNVSGTAYSDSVVISRIPYPAVIAITNPAANIEVDAETTAITVSGTNNQYTVGTMWWTNATAGSGGEWSVAGGGWLVADIPLATGENVIAVSGTNWAGEVAGDSVTVTRSRRHAGNSPVHYVSSNGLAIWPYTNWVEAATTIQDAVDTASDGDTVLVTNGTYLLTSEIKVKRATIVCSVNGVEVTVVDGQGLCRGFYLSNDTCSVSGFTITNATTSLSGGGIYCRYSDAIVSNCCVSGCQASYGGGVSGGTLKQCVLRGNTATNSGGGSYSADLDNCLVIGNTAATYGGGNMYGDCRNCTIFGNSAGTMGGGSQGGALWNCIIWSNTAPSYTDIGISVGTRKNVCSPDISYCDASISNYPRFKGPDDFRLAEDSPCINAGDSDSAPEGVDLAGNPRVSGRAVDIGAYECQYSNIYVDASRPDDSGGGLSWASAKKTIQAGVDFATTNLPVLLTNGTYLLTSEVVISNAITVRGFNGRDVAIVDGQDVCRCFVLGNNACTLAGLTITNGNAVGAAGGGVYCSGTVPIITNCVVSGNHADMDAGGINRGTVIDCILSGNTAGDEGGGTSHSDVFDSTLSENSAATNAGGAFRGSLVRCTLAANTAVDNGGGAYEAALTNCTLMGNSSGGQGGGAFSCTLTECTLTNNASVYGGGACRGTLSDCAIADNHADTFGGGVCSGSVVRCMLDGNVADQNGGGAYGGEIYNSLLTGNTATNYGGGACNAALTNCTLSGNLSAYRGGGISGGTIINCIVWSNSASDVGQDIYTGIISNTCASDGVANGVDGCITNNPLFSDPFTADYAPLPASPCINAGNDDALDGIDLAGNPRIAGARVDMGAYEYQYSISYVDASRPDDSGDGFSWGTAKKTIQAGVDLQPETLWVSNGTYAITSEINVPATMIIASMNGPAVTTVDGQGLCRGFYSDHVFSLIGLTISNGFSSSQGGGAYGNYGTVSNCVICNCQGQSGGGLYRFNVYDSVICSNTASSLGGGLYYCNAFNCEISDNSAVQSGGGLRGGEATDCIISNNATAGSGGGAADAVIDRCRIENNSAGEYGGGLSRCYTPLSSWVQDSLIINNEAPQGGGTYRCSLYNCTLFDNHATDKGGGSYYAFCIDNCVIWGNAADYSGDNIADCACSPRNTCTTEAITNGMNGCFTNRPMLAGTGNAHLLPGSPCINAGSDDLAQGPMDIDGESRTNTVVDIGCDEVWASALTGTLNAGIYTRYGTVGTNIYVFVGAVQLLAAVEGRPTMTCWTFHDGTKVTNLYNPVHTYATTGAYAVSLMVSNLSGVANASVMVHVLSEEDAARYVRIDGDDGNSGASWAEAKATIQGAVDATIPGATVYISNGVYAVTSAVCVAWDVTIESVNGPHAAIVDGQGLCRGFELGDSLCILDGLTVTNGYTANDGGGIYCSSTGPLITNCVLSGNAAANGGGICGGRLYHCTLGGNTVTNDGGGAIESLLHVCTITNNTARHNGGGVEGCTLYGCTVVDNVADNAGGGIYCANTTLLITNCVIRGNTSAQDGGGVNRGTIVDCVISGNHAGDEGGGTAHSEVFDSTLSGNSASNNAGGTYYGTLVRCVLAGNTTDARGGGAYTATLTDCTLTGNTAVAEGGGAARGTLVGCTLANNTTYTNGGGAFEAVLSNCTLRANSCSNQGGGAFDCTLSVCTLTNNTADNGGGACEGSLTDCMVVNNRADAVGGGVCSGAVTRCRLYNNVANQNGGGVYGGAVYNCLLLSNTATNYGGGACDASLTNCTLSGNVCAYRGGGLSGGATINCIIWSNTAPDTGKDVYDSSIKDSCASDGLTNGVAGCITNNPLFADPTGFDYALFPASPCINEGNSGSLNGIDLAGHPRVVGARVDMGAYEYQYSMSYVDDSRPDDSGDGFSWATAKKTIQAGANLKPDTVCITNGTYALSSTITVPATMVIRSMNGPEVTTVDGMGACRGFETEHPVSLIGLTITNCFSWSQGGAAFKQFSPYGTVSNCLICNCRGSTGGGLYGFDAYNSVIRNNTGDRAGGLAYASAYNCDFYGNSAVEDGGGAYFGTLSGCMLSNNTAGDCGGGVWRSLLRDCILVNNHADESGGGAYSSTVIRCCFDGNTTDQNGGGTCGGTLRDCLLTGNTAATNGGGACSAELVNSTLFGNQATCCGGGIAGGTAINCVVWSNTAFDTGNDIYDSTVTNSCASDGLTNGVDSCITNDPQFVDASSSNYQFQAASPCINVGDNDAVSTTNDLADNPRIINAIVDMGAYEYIFSVTDYDGDEMLNTWESRHALDENDSADRLLNPDGDLYNNVEEYIADTDPQNSNSFFHVTGIDDSASCVVSFVCTNSRVYSMQSATNLVEGKWVPVDGSTNITGVGSSMSLTDSVDSVQQSYRVGVSVP